MGTADPFVVACYRAARAARMCGTMRDADVGASPGPGSAADSAAARACTKAAAAAASAGRQPGRQQRADHPGQHVAGAGGGRPGLPGGIEVDRAAGIGDDRDVALEQHGGAERVGQLAARADPVVPGRVTRQSGEFTRVRCQHRRRAAIVHAVRGGPPGWSARRRRRSPAGRSPARTTARRRPASSVPNPGPTTQDCTRPADAGVGDAITSGQCASTSRCALPA